MDKPIQARKVSVRERLVKWGRRQPLLAAAAGTITIGEYRTARARRIPVARRRTKGGGR